MLKEDTKLFKGVTNHLQSPCYNFPSFRVISNSTYDIITIIKTNKPKLLGGGNLDWINDGFCDDINNNVACEFDNRDCCGMHVDKRYCVECKCLSKSKIVQKEL